MLTRTGEGARREKDYESHQPQKKVKKEEGDLFPPIFIMLNCNTYSTNAPIICNSITEAQSFAERKGNTMIVVDPILLITTLKKLSQDGGWCVVKCSEVETDALREAVSVVWLKGNWHHHNDFRAWFIHEPFLTPLTSQFTLENTSSGFSLSPARGSTVASRLRIEAANAHLPQSLIAGAVYLKYTDTFEDEFDVRSLVNAVGNCQLFYTTEYRRFVNRLQPRHILGLFRLAVREDIFVALTEQGLVSDDYRRVLVDARGDANESLMDVALKKEFIQGASLLRDLGCTSDAFDFNDLLKPSFSVALRVLLQPDKPFPFNAVDTASHIARAGSAEVLKRIFFCRVDSHFEHSDYPLTDACKSNSEEIVWIVLDRMGSTGVSPLTEPRWAQYHLIKVLREVVTENIEGGERVYSIGTVGKDLASRLLSVLEEDGTKIHFPVDVLERSQCDKTLTSRVMGLLDPTLEPNAPNLLRFFAEYDPKNEHMEGLVRRAFREMHSFLDSRPVEKEVYHLLWHLLRQGADAKQMFLIAVDCCIHYGHLDFTFRGDAGDTLLHKAIQIDGVDVDTIGSMLYRMSERDRLNLIRAEDASGMIAARALVERILKGQFDKDQEQAKADILRLFLFAGATFSGEAAAKAYRECVTKGYPLIAFELLESSQIPFDFVSLPETFAARMCLRSRVCQNYDESYFKTVSAMASDSLTAHEKHSVSALEGSRLPIISLVTYEVDQRLAHNSLPFRVSAHDQQKLIGCVLDFCDTASFNGFKNMCFATRIATLGRSPPPALGFGKDISESNEAQ